MDDVRFDAHHLTSDQYRGRAQLARSSAAKMDKLAMRRQLLEMAEEYEWIADSMERTSGAKPRWI
jgi:hypothetical protein